MAEVVAEIHNFSLVSLILHWRDPIRTGLLFGIINLAYFLVYYGEYSVVTLFNYCALALLGTAFAYAYGLILWARYVQGNLIENPLRYLVTHISTV